MTEANLLTITAGDREVIDIALTGLTDAQLTGTATATFTARWRQDSPTAVLQYTIGSGITVNTGPSLSIAIDGVDTSWIRQHVGLVYDVEVSPNDGSGPLTVVSGRLIVNPGVS